MDSVTKSILHKYWWILFIPIFGAFYGLIILFRFIAGERDFQLLHKGILGFAFTIISLAFLDRFVKRTDSYRQGVKEFVESELNKVLNEIEEYKKAKGNYPSSLYLVYANIESPPFHDPVFQKGENSPYSGFVYKLSEDGYILFSVGLDKTPNTIDDIFPTATSHNPNAFGLKFR